MHAHGAYLDLFPVCDRVDQVVVGVLGVTLILVRHHPHAAAGGGGVMPAGPGHVQQLGVKEGHGCHHALVRQAHGMLDLIPEAKRGKIAFL